MRKIILAPLFAVLLVLGFAPSASANLDADGDGIPNKYEQAGWFDQANDPNAVRSGYKWSYGNYPIACNTDPSAPAFRFVLVHPSNQTPDVSTNAQKEEFREFTRRVASVYAASARRVINTQAQLKDNSTPRFTTFQQTSGECAATLTTQAIARDKFPQGCEVVNGTLSCQPEDVSVSEFFNYMQSLGYNESNRKYIYLLQTPVDSGFSGVAQGYGFCDTNKSVSNCSNYGSHIAVDRFSGFSGMNYWGSINYSIDKVRTTAHEIGHSIGMTGANSPDKNPQNGQHSKDCWDVMCYVGGTAGIPGQVYTGGCGQYENNNSIYTFRLDCNNDGSFNANNPTTGYLSTNWNTADNVFLWGGLTPPSYSARPTIPTVDDSTIIVDTHDELHVD